MNDPRQTPPRGIPRPPRRVHRADLAEPGVATPTPSAVFVASWCQGCGGIVVRPVKGGPWVHARHAYPEHCDQGEETIWQWLLAGGYESS